MGLKNKIQSMIPASIKKAVSRKPVTYTRKAEPAAKATLKNRSYKIPPTPKNTGMGWGGVKPK